MKLLNLVPLLGFAYAATEDGITVTCNDDNTIAVTIEYDNVADILELTYGTCNENSDGIKGADSQNSENGWDLAFNVTACGMDSKLRTLEYEQNAKVRVGRKSQDLELTMANFEIESYCEYTATYTVKFDYGTLSTEAHEFAESGGLIGLDIVINSFESTFNSRMSGATKGGKTIYLGMEITNEGVVFNDDTEDRSGKQFAPQSCSVNDTGNNLQYTLFDAVDGDCANADVDLTVAYDSSTHMWQFSHTLFLLDDYRSSSFELICEVIVCEASVEDNACDAINDKCLGGDVCTMDADWNVYLYMAGVYDCQGLFDYYKNHPFESSKKKAEDCSDPIWEYGGWNNNCCPSNHMSNCA